MQSYYCHIGACGLGFHLPMLRPFPTGVKVLGYHLGGSSGRSCWVTVAVRHYARLVIRTVDNLGGIFKKVNRIAFKLLELAPLISVIYFMLRAGGRHVLFFRVLTVGLLRQPYGGIAGWSSLLVPRVYAHCGCSSTEPKT